MADRLPRLLLHLEGAVVAVAAIVVYLDDGQPWWLLFVLALAPDLSAIGFVAGPYAGAIAYDVAHTYALPVPIAALGVAAELDWAVIAGLVWIAHIGFDRVIGYGLKYPDGFSKTHLQRV